ncbi:MAG: SprT-like domain-containing protein [Bacteroidetes bacterium]|nr:SprT-like domain-containing protein [Bacteroidota bacterium]MDA1269173.1 SprT-like domain-containing protein [Bacteroidota bacterium]
MSIPSTNLLFLFQKHLPESAVPYCIQLWEESPFHFFVKKPRNTKLGDFRFRRDQSIQTITLNLDLNPYQFLLTLIHEIAHLRAFAQNGTAHAPHGHEWKAKFKQLLDPLLNESTFPRDILVPLKLHMRNPSASSARDLFLMKEMSKYDMATLHRTTFFLADLAPQTHFELAGRKFKKGETLRTRILCEELSSGKKFLVSQLAKVGRLD